MVNFRCTNCNYKFQSEKPQKTCPYCNKPAVVKEPSAEDILNDLGMEE